jgi:CRP/FNR family transcriptional regulator
MKASVPSLLREYPAFAALDPATRDDVLSRHAQWVEAPKGAVLFDEGSPCRGYPLLVSGEVRVARGSAAGRALELYRIQPGEICVLSTACLVGGSALHARGTTTRPSQLVLLDRVGFERCCANETFRRFVFGVFATRLADLLSLVEAVAFQRLDQRLAAALLGHGSVVCATHQALADQLGTSREIVTRLLLRFEREAWVNLARERIELIDAPALRVLAGHPQVDV